MTMRKLAITGLLALVPAMAYAQVTCTKKTFLVTIPSGGCSTTYRTGTISCGDGTTYEIAPTLVSETCGSSLA